VRQELPHAPRRPRPDPAAPRRRLGLRRLLGFLLIALLVGGAGSAGLWLWSRLTSPSIAHLDPVLAEPGGVITVEGHNFGEKRGESRVELDGVSPTASSYLSWSDDRIAVRLPPSASSGLVYVVTRQGRSNPKLFMNRQSLPTRPTGVASGGTGPFLAGLSTASGPIGSLVVISGRSFGQNREGGSVLFARGAEESAGIPETPAMTHFAENAEGDFGYELWSDKEIRVRVPDGASSGAIVVKTAAGTSNASFFEVTGNPGEKRYGDRRSYAISQEVTITRVRASGPNELYLWLPRPVVSASQRIARVLAEEPLPLVEDYRGVAIYRWKDLAAGGDLRARQSFLVESLGVETSIRPERIVAATDLPALVAAYRQADSLVPAAAPAVTNLARRIVGAEKNPWRAARLVWDWLLANVAWTEARDYRNALDALEARRADSESYATLACALLRAAGVPALPVSGSLVDPSRRAVRHAWVEFWIYGFGWVPMDPVLGGGASPGGIAVPFEDRSRYFGNLDSRRIAFSRGFTDLSPMTQGGRRSSPSRPPAWQSFFEEAAGSLEGYSSWWGEMEVTGLY
jgi:hypothetical protein